MKQTTHEKSSNLHSSTYDEQTGTLRMTFMRGGKAGDTYRYENVPAHLYDGLAKAQENGGSAGTFFHTHIRKNFTGIKEQQ